MASLENTGSIKDPLSVFVFLHLQGGVLDGKTKFIEFVETKILLDVRVRQVDDVRVCVLDRRFPLGVRTVKTVLNPISGESMMLGMTKVVFSILLSCMMAIGQTMESGRRGYGASSGWKVF
ncbi:hypothetical protein TNCV_4767721 [Trichonephila clavipes]|nr:hypothetical protein TNCV_4767721 [Trichonephila clavipes]